MGNTSLSAGTFPALIQGGMGVAISGWRLARAVARRGHLGVVSGTALERVVARRLQEGDADGRLRRAFDAYPDREVANRVYQSWHRPEGLSRPGVYRPLPMFSQRPPKRLVELAAVAAFAEVWLAKDQSPGPVGINLLEKIQTPTLPILYGALLAGVDYVLMGAGIPKEIPGHIEKLRRGEPATLRLAVDDGAFEPMPFEPSDAGQAEYPLARPKFLAIVSSHTLAQSLARVEGVDGFIVEAPIAGGHNAGPRGWSPKTNETPLYGPKDLVDLERLRKLGRPFWLAGGQDSPDSLLEARKAGAAGIQVGTAFAFCAESGMEEGLRRRALAEARRGGLETRTEGRGSPTGYPFKTLSLAGTEGARPAEERQRQPCTHGYLRSAYRKSDGSVGWRCAAEPVEDYVAKGGRVEDCVDRRCLCRGLLATAGHPDTMRSGELERPLITAGELRDLERFGVGDDYTADDVIDSFTFPEGWIAAERAVL